MTDWETIGYRVEWIESPAFDRLPETPHHVIVLTESEVLETLRRITELRPITERPLHSPRVIELQQRVETREIPCGLAGWRS